MFYWAIVFGVLFGLFGSLVQAAINHQMYRRFKEAEENTLDIESETSGSNVFEEKE